MELKTFDVYDVCSKLYHFLSLQWKIVVRPNGTASVKKCMHRMEDEVLLLGTSWRKNSKSCMVPILKGKKIKYLMYSSNLLICN